MLPDIHSPAERLTGESTGFVWRPATPPSSTLVLVHGLQSHAGWFVDAGPRLAERGVAVYAPDRRGSGADTSGVRGDIADYRHWLMDLEQVIRQARADYPRSSIHLVGHCFGANVALGCALRKHVDNHVRSVVMLTPGLYVLPGYGLFDRLRIGLASVFAPETRFRVPQDDALFSRDPEVVAWIGADTLGARSVTARCLVQVDRMLRELRNSLGNLDVPLLVVEASRDRLSDNMRNRRLLEARLGERCRWVSFDAEHFLLAEPCRDQVIDALVDWTTATCDGKHVERSSHENTDYWCHGFRG